MNLVILISGATATGSSSVAKIVADNLRLTYFSPGMLAKSIIGGDESYAVIRGLNSGLLKSPEFQRRIEAAQKLAAINGNVVIDGKLSVSTLSQFATLSVWLKASRRSRILRIAKRGGLTNQEAELLLKAREADEVEAWKTTLGLDFWSQEEMADICIDTDRILPAQVAKIIVMKLKESIRDKQALT